MRWIMRILITWAALLTLGYFIGLPYAAQYLTGKTKAETLAQCAQQLRDKGLMGSATAAITEAQGDQYCHCLADPLALTQADILALVKQRLAGGEQKPPARLETQLKTQVDACNPQLQQAIMQKYGSGTAQTITIQ